MADNSRVSTPDTLEEVTLEVITTDITTTTITDITRDQEADPAVWMVIATRGSKILGNIRG